MTALRSGPKRGWRRDLRQLRGETQPREAHQRQLGQALKDQWGGELQSVPRSPHWNQWGDCWGQGRTDVGGLGGGHHLRSQVPVKTRISAA